MSLYLDKKYINLVSSTTEKFKWKKSTVANMRCPLCGDSSSNRTKTRGYFFASENSFFYKCHNCGAAHNVYKFLEIYSPSLFKEYCLERFLDGKNRSIEDDVIIPPTTNQVDFHSSKFIKEIYKLPNDHKVIKFLHARKIPKNQWCRFQYTENFKEYAKDVNEEYQVVDDDRIIIPIYDESNQFIGAQGRAFGDTKPKYVTLKTDESIKLVYGMNHIDRSKPVLVVEGPIDSLFLPNAIACLGLGNFLEIRERYQNLDLIFVLDNEPRSRSLTDIFSKLIQNNEKICIFPEHIKEKDINDMALHEIDVCGMITNHTYQGAAAMLAFNSWRKCK